MKWFFNPCRRHRRNISLLASGALPETEKGPVENHLTACADCRKYFVEIKAVTVPLANWAKSLPQFKPGEFSQRRWTRAIETACRPNAIRQFAPVAVFCDWAREVFWPSRRVWEGLAAVWLVILAGNVSLHEPSPAITAKSAARFQEAINSFKDQQEILAELLADHSAPGDAGRQKFFSPKPHTQNKHFPTA